MNQYAWIILFLLVMSCASMTGPALSDSGPPQSWNSGVTAGPIAVDDIGGTSYDSSSRLLVEWRALPEGYDRVSVTITDLTTQSSRSELRDSGANSMTLTGLKSATGYDVSVQACVGEACSSGPNGGSAEGETAQEVWQLLGDGDSINGLTNIVFDSNAKMHAFVYGSDAPHSLRGHIQLYYGAMGGLGGSLSVATSNRPADASDDSSYSDFTSYAGSSGLIEPGFKKPGVKKPGVKKPGVKKPEVKRPEVKPEDPSTLVVWIGTGQAVPLSERAGGGVRLFFEARGSDKTTRIMSLDSDDAYVGKDFHSGGAEFCSLAAEYEEGGGCHPTVEIGAEGDDIAATEQIKNVRQQKVGVPTLSDWRWNEQAGTFMVFTTGRISGCSPSKKNHGYARYDGDSWEVQYLESGCPKLFQGVQAMAPLDLGDGTFKIQFGNPDESDGKLGSNLPFLGPKRIIYGHPARSGDPDVMEFEDWDAVEDARDLIFLWPDGTVFDVTAEGYIDDFVLLTPTFDVEHQIQFVVLTDGSKIPFTSVAILKNR